MKICFISDTHLVIKDCSTFPDADILVHAGDIMNGGYRYEQDEVCYFLGLASKKYKNVILVPGNHDWWFQSFTDEAKARAEKMGNVHILIDESIVIDGIKFYGSPYTRWFYDWAYNMPKNEDAYKIFAKEKWNNIPSDVDVLITHGQPYGINDRTREGDLTGCKFLLNRINKLTKLKAYAGGHIHEEYGQKEIKGVKYINPSLVNRFYKFVNKPIVIEL